MGGPTKYIYTRTKKNNITTTLGGSLKQEEEIVRSISTVESNQLQFFMYVSHETYNLLILKE